ncbi:MAG: phytoene dehydrogenase [Halobacteriovoraceae bacterium]|nr:phytoene dehydrogenase [Halobacteriovoraceae bacterium]|tara:strand:- start:15849 stop:17261 length:1413 start_codon:yes stop_codon:yes gene_type:complete
MSQSLDAIVIGAGMSGLAAGLRLAMFDKKVVLLEAHSISGGLNSYYSRKVKETKEKIPFDVGLHALTNFAEKGERKKPLTKMLKQLRLPYDSLELSEQTFSQIQFKSASLKFSNDFKLLEEEVRRVFPSEIDSFRKFVKHIEEFNDLDLNLEYTSARSVLSQYFKEELLSEMLIAPLLIYGSAWEHDMDFAQFVTMFKSIYFEGFARPKGGVRTILELLLEKAEKVGLEIRFKTPVKKILVENNQAIGVELKKGEVLRAKQIYSSAGLPETYALINNENDNHPIGKLSFMESILVTEDKSFLKDNPATIIFYNDFDRYSYKKPNELFDSSSAVFCLPDNYDRDLTSGHGLIRVTYMANFNAWSELKENSKKTYKEMKQSVFDEAHALSQKLLGQDKLNLILHDVFSPTTIKKYTSHFEGTVYGSPKKTRDGKSDYKNLFIIGTDQGFLGIVGSLLSGISMANFHGLMEGE